METGVIVRYYVYILASKRNGTLYVGVTNDLSRRTSEHRNGMGAVFVRRYGVNKLVCAEPYDDVRDAIAQEKRIKKWRRAWKPDLIERMNSEWRDL